MVAGSDSMRDDPRLNPGGVRFFSLCTSALSEFFGMLGLNQASWWQYEQFLWCEMTSGGITSQDIGLCFNVMYNVRISRNTIHFKFWYNSTKKAHLKDFYLKKKLHFCYFNRFCSCFIKPIGRHFVYVVIFNNFFFCGNLGQLKLK